MKIIVKEDRIIYRADKNKKVKFVNTKKLYSEIVVSPDDKRKVKEVSMEGDNDGNI